MDSQVDEGSHPQVLKEGERIEVRQKDVWHPGTIVGLKAGHCVVEYDELLTDDSGTKLRESIPYPKAIEKCTSSPGICTPQKNTAVVANSARSPSKRHGLLRPSPPICTEPSPFTWKRGLYVDVFYQDAWWEAVLVNDVTSLDDDAYVYVIYPDEGGRSMVPAKNLRISQFWDEVTGQWNIKGSIDLTRFLRRRGFGMKEVTLIVDSECKGNSQNNSTQGEMAFCEKESTQTCPSSDSRHGEVPSFAQQVHIEHIVADSPSTDKDSNENLPLTCTSDGVLLLDSLPSKVCLETLMSSGRSGEAIHEESHNANIIEKIGNGSEEEMIEKEDVGECMPSSMVVPLLCGSDKSRNGSAEEMIEREDVEGCMPSPFVKDESVYDNLRSKKRRIEDACAISYGRERAYSCSQPTSSSPVQSHCPPQNHQLETTNLIREEPGFVKEWSLDRGSSLHSGVIHNRGGSNLESSSKFESAKVIKENALQQSVASEVSVSFRKKRLNPLSTGILGSEKSNVREKRVSIKKENNLPYTRPIFKKHLLALAAPVQRSKDEYDQITSAGKHLLALAAPVRKSKEEYDQITSAGKAALDGYLHEPEERPTKQAGNEAPFRMSREKYGQITLVGKRALEGGMDERALRPGRHIRKESPPQKSLDECDKNNLAGKEASEEGVHQRALRLRRGAGKERSIQKFQEEDNRVVLARNTLLEGAVIESARSGRRAQAEMPSQQSREEYGQRISAGKEVPVQKSQEVSRFTLAGKAMLEGVVNERAGSGRRAQAEMPIQEPQKYERILSAGKEEPAQKSQAEDNRVALAGKAVLEGSVTERIGSQRRARVEIPIQESREEYRQRISVGKALLEGEVQGRGMRRGRQSGVTVHGWKSGEYVKITSEKATPEVRFGGQAGESPRSADKVERRGRKDTLELYKKRLMRQKQVNALKSKAFNVSPMGGSAKVHKVSKEPGQAETATAVLLSKTSSIPEVGGKHANVLKASREPGRAETATAALLSNIEDKSLKCLAREIGKRAVMEAGYTVYYKPRRGTLSLDAIWTSPKGPSYWSLPKAWQALEIKDRKGNIKVEKVVVQQVLSKINLDEQLRSAFEKLDRFSGMCLQDVMRTASFTYDELTDLLLEDLGVLRKHMPSKKKKQDKLHRKERGKITDISTDFKNDIHSKPLLVASETSVIKKRGRKRKQDVERLQQEVDHRASASNLFSSPKEDDVPKSENNLPVLKEGKRRTWLMGAKKVLVSKPSSLSEALTPKSQIGLKGSSKSNRNEVKSLKAESRSRKKENTPKPRSGFRLEVRPSSSTMNDESEDLSCRSKQTVTSWMIDRGAVLEKEKIFYVDKRSNESLKEGVLTREGILCRCCKKVYTVQNFEEHGGSQERVAHCNLNFTSGRSFLDCQLEAWNVEVQLRKTHNYKGVTVNDTNDDTCLLCGDGGDLLCCDLCPSTFHASCLQLDNVPEGNWYCPKCRCGVCRDRNGSEEELSMAVCRQCEHRYHIACLCGGHTVVEGKFFCGHLCRKIYSGLRKLIGITHSLDKGFSWTLLHCMEEDTGSGANDIKLVMKNNSKLAVALLVLKECFNPMDDPRTNIDMITHAVYNRWSQFDRLNYVGFYTAVLEKDDEIISVATIRIHGARVAEMPLIGTRHKYRRQGMCRLLVGVIEKLLCSLEVGTFILPAISELFETWTKAFGFRPLDSSQRSDIKDLSMMVFPETDLLQKPIPQSSGGNIALVQICDSAVELLRSSVVDDAQDGWSVGSRPTADIETNRLHHPSGGGSPSRILDHNKDDDIIFDACPSTNSSLMVEKGVLNSSSGSPLCGGLPSSPSAKGVLMGRRDKQEPNANFWQAHRRSSGDGDSVNAEGFLNELRDDGSQKPGASSVNAKGLINEPRHDGSPTFSAKHTELLKTDQHLDCMQVDGGLNNSLTADITSDDAWIGRLQPSEPSYNPEQPSPGGVGIGSANNETLEMKSHLAEPMVIDSTSLVGGNQQTSEWMEKGHGVESSNPNSDSVPALSEDGGSLSAIAPFDKPRIDESLRPEQSLGTDAPIAECIEEKGSITHKS